MTYRELFAEHETTRTLRIIIDDFDTEFDTLAGWGKESEGMEISSLFCTCREKDSKSQEPS